MNYKQDLSTEASLLAFAAHLAQATSEKTVIFLSGPLGAGKTTFARGFLRGLGYAERVKSPTYTFVEPYCINDKKVIHADLYRLKSLRELEELGLRDDFAFADIALIEWPERFGAGLPLPDLTCELSFSEKGRGITLTAQTLCGDAILTKQFSA